MTVFDGNELNQDVYDDIVDINTMELMDNDKENSYLCNMLGKQKKSINQAAAKRRQAAKNTRESRPGFTRTKEEIDEILSQGDPEKWAFLLHKHRNLYWSIRVIAYMMKCTLFYRGQKDVQVASLIPNVILILLQQASFKTQQYIYNMSGIHEIIYEDANGTIKLENRQFIGANDFPEESTVLSLNTALAQAILRYSHDRHHLRFSRSIRAAVRSGEDHGISYYIPRCRQFLDRESRNCPRCILSRSLRMQAKMGSVPRRRYQKQDVMKHIQIDGFGPFWTKSLLRADRRQAKCWGLVCCCLASGIVSVQMLMDSSASSVIIALNTLKAEFGDIRSISFDPATNFTPMTKFSDDAIEDVDENDFTDSLDSFKEYATANGIQTYMSPPKTSHYQGMAEKYIDKIKTLLYLRPQQNLHIIELQCLFKQLAYILNSRPVSMDQDGCILTRLHLLGHRKQSGVDAELFNQPPPMIHAGRFQDHVEEIEELVDNFWVKFKDLLLEEFLRIQSHRFPGEIIAQIGDICAVPDKCHKNGGLAIGEIIAIKPSDDGETRVVVVEVARKKRRSHPFPLNKATHRIKKYERHVHNLIFLLRPERDHLF